MAKDYVVKKTQFPGVRYREYAIRKATGKLDRYFFIYYRLHGILKEEKVGWASEGWNATKANAERANLKRAQATGEGAQTLAEKRQLRVEKKEAEQQEKERLARENLPFRTIFQDHYLPKAKANKTKGSWQREESLNKKWISPVIGSKPLKDINSNHLDEIKKAMLEKGRADRTINYALDLIRQVFNYAISRNLYDGNHPIIKDARIPNSKLNNERVRFLTPDEVNTLLDALKKRSKITYEHAIISINCGLRAGEIFSLTWGDIVINTKEPYIVVKDSKKGSSRSVPMTTTIQNMFNKKKSGQIGDLIYPPRKKLHEHEIINRYCGLSDLEISGLTWGDIVVDTKEPHIILNDSKNGTRHIPMPKPVVDMFRKKRNRRNPDERIYPIHMVAISDAFERTAESIGLNKGVKDRRQKVVFHTCRHTYGSWMAQSGVSLYTIMQLMGHKNIETTQRYAHLCNSNFQNAVRVFEENLTNTKDLEVLAHDSLGLPSKL
jgi:integrase